MIILEELQKSSALVGESGDLPTIHGKKAWLLMKLNMTEFGVFLQKGVAEYYSLYKADTDMHHKTNKR